MKFVQHISNLQTHIYWMYGDEGEDEEKLKAFF